MKCLMTAVTLAAAVAAGPSFAEGSGATMVETPYEEPKVLFDFYFDRPDKLGPALYWIRSLTLPLSQPP
jgi:uncharacterized protein